MGRGGGGVAADAPRRLARAGQAPGGGRVGGGREAPRRPSAHPRRLSRPSGDLRALRRPRRPGGADRPRQARRGHPRRLAALRRDPEPVRGGPLPLARRPLPHPGGAGGNGAYARRRGDGRPPPDRLHPRRTVPPGVGVDAARAAPDRELPGDGGRPVITSAIKQLVEGRNLSGEEAHVLEALGVRIDLSPADVAACIDEVGFGFLFAQAHHPAMRHAGPIRRELGIRSVFNLLGPLTNPAGARRQVIGVYSESLVEPIAQVLSKLGAEHALVVHGAGGLDELTPTGENLVAEVRDGAVALSTLDPAPLSTGPVPGSPDDLRCGGDPAQNAAVILTVFDGERGPRRDAVILNAEAALLVGGVVADWEAGIDLAVETIDTGAAQAKLDQLVEFTRARGAAA